MPTKKLTPSEFKHKNINIPSGDQDLTAGFPIIFNIVDSKGQFICKGKSQMNGARLNIASLYNKVLLDNLGLNRPLIPGDEIVWDVKGREFVIKDVKQPPSGKLPSIGAPPLGNRPQPSVGTIPVKKLGSLNVFSVIARVNRTLSSSQDFKLFYKNLINELKRGQFYFSINPKTTAALRTSWPANHGVYVIKNKETGDLIYVGKAGTFKKGKLVGNLINKTNNRKVPYEFTKKDEFAYNLNLKGGEKYISLTELEIDCFVVDKCEFDAPASLESLILQAYLMCYKNLPLANNAF